jgi:hypothetical protein
MDASAGGKVGLAMHKDQKVQLFTKVTRNPDNGLRLSKNRIENYSKYITKIRKNNVV